MTNAPERIGLGSHGDYWADEDIKDGDTVYIRADLVPQWQPIETAPKDGIEVLVWAMWDWDGMCGDNCDQPYRWRVASYTADSFYNREEDTFAGAFWAKTSNPYTDLAVKPLYWMPLPTPPEDETT